MLPRRRRSSRPGSSLPLLVLGALLLAAAAAFSPAAAAAAEAAAGREARAGKQEAEAQAEAEARGERVAVAEAGGEVAAQGNATDNKEGSFADMIDRALEKEFPESEGEQGGGGACGSGRPPRDPPPRGIWFRGAMRWRVSVAVLARSRRRWLERLGIGGH